MGLRNLQDMNTTCLLKIVRKLVSGNLDLWARILIAKYGRSENWKSEVQVKNADLFLWKALGKIWHYVNEGVSWSIGNGKQVSL